MDDDDEVTGCWHHFPHEHIKNNKVNIIISPCGTGKTTAIAAYLRGYVDEPTHYNHRILVMTFRQTLAIKLSKDLGCHNYLEDTSKGRIDFDETQRLVISPESLHRLGYLDNTQGEQFKLPHVLVIDEYMSFIEHMFNDATLTSLKRSLFFNIFTSVLKNPEFTVILADAYIQLSSLETLHRVALIRQVPLTRFLVIRNVYKGEHRTILYTHSYKKWKTLLDLATSGQKNKLYVFSNWKSILDGLQVEYGSLFGSEMQGYPRQVFQGCYYISSDSTLEQKEECSQSCDDVIDDFEHLYASPTIGAGISIDSTGFDRAFGYAGCNSTSPLGTLQLSKRVRTLRSQEVILYVFKSVRKKRGVNEPKRSKDVEYTYDEIVAALQCTSSLVRKGYLECRSMGFQEDERTNTLVRVLDTKDVVNQFLIDVVKRELDSKLNYIGALRKLALVDNYRFKSLDTQVFKNRREEFYDTNVATELVLSNSKLTISRTMECAQVFRVGCIAHWDGIFDHATSPILQELENFFSEWNVLGAYGYFRDMIVVHSDSNIQKQVMYNSSQCAIFYDNYIHGRHQEAFHRYISQHISLAIASDHRERLVGGTRQEALESQLLMRLVELYRVAPVVKYRDKSWFGKEGEVSFSGHDFEASTVVPPNDPALTLSEQAHNVDLKYIRDVLNNMYSEFDEATIDTQEKLLEARTLLKEYWSVIMLGKNFINIKILGKYDAFRLRAEEVCFLNHTEITPDDRKAILGICGSITRKLLTSIGLKAICRKRRNKNRNGVTLNHYTITKFSGRLMLSVLRFLQQSQIKPWRLVNYPEPDPFHLLAYDPNSFITSPHNNRFKRECRVLWSELPSYWADISKASSVRNTQEYNYHAIFNPIPPISVHAPSRLSNINLFALIWRFYNSKSNEKMITTTGLLYTPVFFSAEAAEPHLYLNFMRLTDHTRIEFDVGKYTSEEWDSLDYEAQFKVIDDLRAKYPNWQPGVQTQDW